MPWIVVYGSTLFCDEAMMNKVYCS